MTYLADKWIWLSFATGLLVGSGLLLMSFLPGVANIFIFRGKLSANAALWWGVLMTAGWCIFEVYYAGFAYAHFQSPLPYFFATLGGGFLAAVVGSNAVATVRRITTRALEKRSLLS